MTYSVDVYESVAYEHGGLGEFGRSLGPQTSGVDAGWVGVGYDQSASEDELYAQ